MKRSNNLKPLGRAVVVVSATVALVTGVTFAALQSQQNTLTGNTIETATANLQISKNDINYANTQTGFDFSGLIPGGPAVPTTGYPFYLKNSGQVKLALKMAVVSAPSNPNNVDLSKVSVTLSTIGGNNVPTQTFSLQSLLNNGGVDIGTIDNNNSLGYKLQIAMATDSVTGNSASVGGIDFAFTGTAVSS